MRGMLAVVALLAIFQGVTPDTYVAATVDARGQLVITTADNRPILIPRQDDQTTFDAPMVSKNGHAVGAQAMYPNCCTSYDIPLRLIVYADGKIHRFSGIGLPIFAWHFDDDGSRVAYSQEPVHFACRVHYELRDVVSERLLEAAEEPEPCGSDPHPSPVAVPQWVRDLKADAR